jgi:hypothetical protein
MLKQITDKHGNVSSVNTDFVTLVEPNYQTVGKDLTITHTNVWVIANSGYHTKCIPVLDSVETVTEYLNSK